mgnify:CR=1 FL=1
MAELFGFSITRLKKTADPKQSFTQPQADDGTQTIAAGGYFGQYLDMEGQAKTEQDLIRRSVSYTHLTLPTNREV